MSPETLAKNVPESARKPARATAPSKLDKTNRLLQTLSYALGIAGALGTLFVWFAANFYTGSIQLKCDKPPQSLAVKAYNEKGSEATFHTEKFDLMPGRYHLEITANEGKTINQDVEVDFHKTVQIAVCVPEASSAPKHHWWQIWKKSNAEEQD